MNANLIKYKISPFVVETNKKQTIKESQISNYYAAYFGKQHTLFCGKTSHYRGL